MDAISRLAQEYETLDRILQTTNLGDRILNREYDDARARVYDAGRAVVEAAKS